MLVEHRGKQVSAVLAKVFKVGALRHNAPYRNEDNFIALAAESRKRIAPILLSEFLLPGTRSLASNGRRGGERAGMRRAKRLI